MKKYVILSITIACILLAGCKKKEDTIKPGSIYGTVVDKSSQASVSGAGVELMPKGLKTVTGSDGSFQFTQIDPGDYNLFVTKTGYQDLKSNTITVNPGETAKGDVQIEKLPASLQIKDNNGNIITELDFGGEEGIVSKTFIIVNRGTMTLNFTINKYVAWIESITPLNGTIPVNRDCPIILQIDREKLSDGLNTTSIIITSEDGGVELPVKARKGGYSGDVFVLESAHLMVQLEDLGCVNWSSAKTLCESSTVADYNDWRLPTKEELSTLYTNRQLIGGFTTKRYWSSSLSNSYSYYVDFADGTIGYTNSSNQYYVRAVRTITNENGIYELASANVMVQTQDLGCVNWTSANLMCQNSTLANYTDWRLPTQAELMILYNNRDIIGGFVTSINGAEYWSSQKNSDGNPVGVDFYNGSLFWNYASKSYNVRAVRTLNGSSATEPTVTTSSVSNVTTNSAICGGNVTSDGGATVTARGVCWSTSPNPTTSNNHTTDGTGTGSFTSSITGLAESTTYYVRAYATNSEGTAYGMQQNFTTNGGGSSATIPTVTTSTPSNVTTNSATCGGNVTSDGGATVTERGVCYSTSPNPTTLSMTYPCGSGTGVFTCNLTGLYESTTYYVRAYAINSEGTAYGTEQHFTTSSGGGGGTVTTTWSDSFEDGYLINWDIIDSDGDGQNWMAIMPTVISAGNAHGGSYCASSWSWDNVSYDPDNYMISPLCQNAISIRYYVATHVDYPDHYAVMVSYTGTNISDFTIVFEETAPVSKHKSNGNKTNMTQNNNTRDMSPWTERNINLPSGTKYVAFRHYNSYDMNYIFIDDVTITMEN